MMTSRTRRSREGKPIGATAVKPCSAQLGLARTFEILCWTVLAVHGCPVSAVLPDEIQVYTDDTTPPREFGVELHVNTTLSGRSEPLYPGEVTPWHALRMTPEINYGVTSSVDVGAYLPFTRTADGALDFAGPRFRVKWIPVRPDDDALGGSFLGANLELSFVQKRFELANTALEVRPIAGYRNELWLLAVNPVLDWALSGPESGHPPSFNPAVKVARTAATGMAVGFEYYAELGPLNHLGLNSKAPQTLFAVIDVDRRPWVLNLGIGRGLNEATDRWTIKAIFDVPFF